MPNEPLELGELVVELRAGLGIAVWQVDAPYEDAVYRRLNVAALRVPGIAWELVAGQDGLHSAREDGDAVPTPLALPDRAVAGIVDSLRWERGVSGLQFLQADNVGLCRQKLCKQVRQALVHVVDAKRRDFDRSD